MNPRTKLFGAATSCVARRLKTLLPIHGTGSTRPVVYRSYRLYQEKQTGDSAGVHVPAIDPSPRHNSIANAPQGQDALDSTMIYSLTGLPNARDLFLRLEAEIRHCQREQGQLAVILCALDGLSHVDKAQGRGVADQLLKSFVRNIKLACREYDYIARVGDDEFVILAPGLKEKDASNMYDRIHVAATISAEEICGWLDLSASVGISFYPRDSRHPAQLLVEANKRMDAMKQDRAETPRYSHFHVA